MRLCEAHPGAGPICATVVEVEIHKLRLPDWPRGAGQLLSDLSAFTRDSLQSMPALRRSPRTRLWSDLGQTAAGCRIGL